jgi:quercetin dioxygenase-like cupin family protein
MSAYTVKNLKDVTDQAAAHGFSPAMESRFAREDLGCEQTGLSYQRLAPGARQPFGHHHDTQEELYVVIGGSGRVKLGDEVVELRPLDAIRVAPQTKRAFEGGPEGLELLAFGDCGIRDVHMVRGFWED